MSVELISNEEYEKLLSEYDYKFQKGDLVCGQVCGYDSEGAVVDIGAKTCAVVPTKEAIVDSTFPIEQNLLLNEKYEFLIIRDEDEDGKMLLSYKRVANAYKWKELEELKEQDAVVQGVVAQVVRGGTIVEVKGIRGFVPSSHLRTKDLTMNVGDLIDLKILTMDASQNNFILSNRKFLLMLKRKPQAQKFQNLKLIRLWMEQL